MSSLNAFAYKEEVHRKLFKKLTAANQSVKESILELLLSDSNSANYLISKIDSGDFSLPLNNFTLIEKLKAHNSSKIKKFLESQEISTVKGVPSLLENEIKRVKTILFLRSGILNIYLKIDSFKLNLYNLYCSTSFFNFFFC